MKEFIEFKEKIKSEKTKLLNMWISSFLCLVFAVYNIFIGFYHGLAWNKSIFAYYVCLFLIRFMIAKNMQKKIKKECVVSENMICYFSNLLILILNVFAIVPIVLMCLFRKTVNVSTITAITIATYTFYKVVVSIIKLSKIKNRQSALLVASDNVDFVDAIMSILTLQNTLILTFGSVTKSISILCVVTSSLFVIMLIIFSLIVLKISKQFLISGEGSGE